MKISVIIPTYTTTVQLVKQRNLLLVDLKRDQQSSYTPYELETIVAEDGGLGENPGSDIFIWGKENVGFTKNVNRAWATATGDFIAIINSDVGIVEGSLYDLCDSTCVTYPFCIEHPSFGNESDADFYGGFFVLPRWISMKYGMLNEDFPHYGSDQDYGLRLTGQGIKVKKVRDFKISHPGGRGPSYRQWLIDHNLSEDHPL